MAFNLKKIEEEFTEAENNWSLEKLYMNLASAKGKALTPVEKTLLRGLLCGYSPAEIAKKVYQTDNSSTVRVYLSNGLYKYIEEMLIRQQRNPVKIQNWSRVTQLLEKAGYKRNLVEPPQLSNSVIADNEKERRLVAVAAGLPDWGEAIDVSVFEGRTKELRLLEQWIITERCRLVALLGMGGIGKTALSVKLAEQLQDNFEYVIWRSLFHTSSVSAMLTQLLRVLSPQQNTELPQTVDSSISELIEYLRLSRCLIVLDGAESILCLGSSSTYLQGYEGYGELIRRVGDSQHQSCLVLTSREKPKEIAAMQGETLPVRALRLTGLSNAEGASLLKSKGLKNSSEEEWRLLIQCYGGNPLFIKIVATAIQDLFGGNIYNFIQQGTVVFGDIREILDRQFNRLSDLEKQIMYWITLNPNAISLRQLQKEIFPAVSQRKILEAIESLQRRSLIERGASCFQEKVVIEYIAERLIEQFCDGKNKVELWMSNTLIETQLKKYIRESRLNADI